MFESTCFNMTYRQVRIRPKEKLRNIIISLIFFLKLNLTSKDFEYFFYFFRCLRWNLLVTSLRCWWHISSFSSSTSMMNLYFGEVMSCSLEPVVLYMDHVQFGLVDGHYWCGIVNWLKKDLLLKPSKRCKIADIIRSMHLSRRASKMQIAGNMQNSQNLRSYGSVLYCCIDRNRITTPPSKIIIAARTISGNNLNTSYVISENHKKKIKFYLVSITKNL